MSSVEEVVTKQWYNFSGVTLMATNKQIMGPAIVVMALLRCGVVVVVAGVCCCRGQDG